MSAARGTTPNALGQTASKTADDPRFHRTLFGSLSDYDESRPPALYYVENGNCVAGYDQLALDYKMAADQLLVSGRESGLDNWLAPTVFMVRQTIELALKALLEATIDRGKPPRMAAPMRGLWTPTISLGAVSGCSRPRRRLAASRRPL